MPQPTVNLKRLREIINKSFSESELRALFFDVVNGHDDYDDLTGDTKSTKVIALIEYCVRRQLIPHLVATIKSMRPDLSIETEIWNQDEQAPVLREGPDTGATHYDYAAVATDTISSKTVDSLTLTATIDASFLPGKKNTMVRFTSLGHIMWVHSEHANKPNFRAWLAADGSFLYGFHVDQVMYSPDSSLLAYVAKRRNLRICRALDGSLLQAPASTADVISIVGFLEDSRSLHVKETRHSYSAVIGGNMESPEASVSTESTDSELIWDIEQQEERPVPTKSADSSGPKVRHVASSFLIEKGDGSSPIRMPYSLQKNERFLNMSLFHNNSLLVAVVIRRTGLMRQDNCAILVWSLENGTKRQFTETPLVEPVTVLNSAQSSRFITRIGSNIYIWDGITGANIATINPTKPISTLKLTYAARHLLVGTKQPQGPESLTIYNVHNGRVEMEVADTRINWVTVQVVNKLSLLQNVRPNTTVLLHATNTDLRLEVNSRLVKRSPDSRYVVCLTPNKGTLSLVDTESGSVVHVFIGHSNEILDFTITEDGEIIASSAKDGTVRLWSVQTGKQLKVIAVKDAEVVQVQFSPDGSCLSGLTSDRRILLWSVKYQEA